MTLPAGPEPAHLLRRMAAFPLIFDGVWWRVEEDPVVGVDLSPEVVCEHEGHALDGPPLRAECQRLKDHAAGAGTPSRRELAEAFERAAVHPSRHLDIG